CRGNNFAANLFQTQRDAIAAQENLMKRIVAGLLASAVSLSFLAADISLANAAPIYVAPSQTMTSDIQQIDHRPGHPPRANPRYKRPDRRPGPRPDGRHEYRRPHNNDVYWRGH